MTTYDEWQTTGTFNGKPFHTIHDNEDGARNWAESCRLVGTWTDGPHFHRRTVTEWQAIHDGGPRSHHQGAAVTYRTDNHWGVTIVSEGDGARCGRPDHDCQRGHLAAVVIDGGDEGDQALAERICALLNADAAPPPWCNGGPTLAGAICGSQEPHPPHEGDEWSIEAYRTYSRWVKAEDTSRRAVYAAIKEAYAAGVADSCTCTKAGPDPACPVHHGRRARGPKPPPVGPDCICDGSGRTCPRHGAVI